MHRKPDATGPEATATPPDPVRLVALLRADEVDAAIDAGLMAFSGDALRALDEVSRRAIVEAQQRLQAAWDARERYRARERRLARRRAEREARRAPATAAEQAAPALPAAAAAALARAKAKAGRQ